MYAYYNTIITRITGIWQDIDGESLDILQSRFDQIKLENEELKDYIACTFGMISTIIPQEQDQGIEALLGQPFHTVRNEVVAITEAALAEIRDLQAAATEEIQPPVSDGRETEEINELKASVLELKNLLETSLSLDKTLVNNDIVDADDEYERELEDRRANLEKEREAFTQACVRLGVQRAALQVYPYLFRRYLIR